MVRSKKVIHAELGRSLDFCQILNTNATYTICGFAVLTILSTKQCDVYQTFGQTADVIVDIKVDVIDTIGLKSLLVFAQKFGLQDWQEVCNITY